VEITRRHFHRDKKPIFRSTRNLNIIKEGKTLGGGIDLE